MNNDLRIGLYEGLASHDNDAYPILAPRIAERGAQLAQIRNDSELEKQVAKGINGLIVHFYRMGQVQEIKAKYPTLKVALYSGMINHAGSEEVITGIAIGERPDFALLNLDSAITKFLEFCKGK